MSGTQNKQKYVVKDGLEVEAFIRTTTGGKGAMHFDSAEAVTIAMDSAGNESGGNLPKVVDEMLGRVPEGKEKDVLKAIYDGAASYEAKHGVAPSGDLLLAAVNQGESIFDTATNQHHDQLSLQPNAAIVAILGTLAEATPFAGYLPADRGSNEARLIIVTHHAASPWGDYADGGLMDGIAAGGKYLGSSRTMELTAPNDTVNYRFAFLASGATGALVPLLRGRSIVYVNGRRAAIEQRDAPSGVSAVPLSGSVNLAGVEYALSGTANPNTGVVTVTPTPALPNGSTVSCEAYVDYEKAPELTPKMGVQASAYALFAAPFRAVYEVTPEARSQFANEVGIDAGAEAMMTVRGQFSLERHYDALTKVKMIGKFINTRDFNFDYALQIAQKTRAMIWQDFASLLGSMSQKMAEDTADHGITHLYVGKNIAAQFQTLPPELFTPSGITAIPSIYRVGKLFGLYEVYYTPKVVVESTNGQTAEILCVGRSMQTARCPIIFGDTAAPVFEPLGVTNQIRSGYAFSTRCFTAVNPHLMSSFGCAVINVTNLLE